MAVILAACGTEGISVSLGLVGYREASDDLLTSTARPSGATREYSYDAQRNLVSVKDAEGAVTSYTVNARGLMTGATDPLGHVTTYAYNAAGDLTKVTDALGRVTAADYDVLGRPVSVTTPAGRTTSTSYDELGRVVRVLADGDEGVGPHSVHWNGLDSRGSAVPAGVYIYRLEAGKIRLSRKMIVAR